ncbi:MAG: sulfate adenylyltransferase small subunit, partial [Verrucomicrobia bacterium]
MWVMVDDDRLPLADGEVPEEKMVRFRTLGCYPLTGAIESEADTVEKIVEEMMTTRLSERSTRAIDRDGDASMEQKKREGYF